MFFVNFAVFYMKKFNINIYNVMKKVSFKFMMAAFAAVLALGFTSCSSDDYVEPTKEVTVEADMTRAIATCAYAWNWLADNGYTHTGVIKQIAYNFDMDEATANSTTMPAITSDPEGQVAVNFTDEYSGMSSTYSIADVKQMIGNSLKQSGVVKDNNTNKYKAIWTTGSFQGYEFKKDVNGVTTYLYAWTGAHVIATNGVINTQHSGGELY